MAFMGMRGNGDWADDQRPYNWRQKIMHEFPNGDTPITAMLGMMSSESTDDPQFYWWSKRLAAQSGAVTSVYIDVGLGTEYVYATHQATHGIANATVYVKAAASVVSEFRIGHVVLLKDASMFDVDMTGVVTASVQNGDNSYLAVKLLEADDNSATSASYNLATVDRIICIGNSNPEGGAIPRAIAYDPVKYYNYTQIFRTALEMTRTASKTRLRTDEQVQEAKREALELHAVEQEMAILFGIRTENTGANGKPQRTFDGILSWLKRNATTAYSATSTDASINNYALNTKYSAQSWLDGGEDWFDACLEYLGTYAPQEVVGLCGSGALTGITKLGKYTGNIQMEPGPNDAYGMKFTTWVNPHITVHLKKHPLMAREPSLKNSMLLFAPKNMKMRTLDDTAYLPDREARGIDGKNSEYLTEIGPEFYFPDQWQFLDNIGVDSLV